MISRKFDIAGLKDVKLFVAQNLDEFTIIIQERIGVEWSIVIERTETIADGEKFDLQGQILETLKEYAKKKKVEEDVAAILNQYDKDDEIHLPD